jgi:hypothetical protein
MHEERFQPPLLTFNYFKRKPGLRLNQMELGDTMNLSVTRPDAFGPLCKALPISQVTMGYDPTFISAGAFGIRE